jgi:dTMP kinase
MAYYLAIEGADGAGKGTVSAALVDQLRAAGRRAALVSFPRYPDTVGGFAIGAFLAGELSRTMTPEAAATLYALDRFESRDHLAGLAEAHDVLVFDRYLASNMAYQAAQVPDERAPALMDWIDALETGPFGLRRPDRSVYLDTPAEVARRFIALKHQRSYTTRTYDEYEADDALQARVRANYAALAAADPAGWQVVQTTHAGEPRPPADLAAEIMVALT